MEIIAEITADEMISHFLRAELDSERWGYTIKEILRMNTVDRSVIEMPDLQDERENALRHKILKEIRGYDDAFIFTNFPKDITWKNVRLNISELSRARYLRSLPWKTITSSSLSIPDAISSIDNHRDLKEIQSIVKYSSNIKVDDSSPKIILVTSNPENELIILEGCVRSTSYCIALEGNYEIEAILGSSEHLSNWDFY